jgi:hypothetical protein
VRAILSSPSLMVIHYLHVQRAGRVFRPFKADAPS